MMRLKFILFAWLLVSATVHAADLTLNVKTDDHRSMISTSFESSQFTLAEGSILGTSAKVDFSYFVSPKLDFEIYLSSALNLQKGAQASFTGLGGYVYYTVWGDSFETQKTVSIIQQSIITDKNNKIYNLQVGAGLDQFLLNGSKSVYSASGIGIGAIYRFNIYDYNLKAAARYSTMTSGANKLQGLFLGLGIVFTL